MPATVFVARPLISALALAATISVVGMPASAQSTSPRAGAASAQIFLIKGLADVFSSGMDALGAKLARVGIAARVESHANSEPIADEITRRYRAGARGPVILVGHSLGADVAGGIARRLNDRRIPVALLVTFGPLGDGTVTPNVTQAVNYYQSHSLWHGRMSAAPGFRGSLTNINLDSAADINHFNIEKADRLQNETIARISVLVRRSPPR
jgi:pimeloyl-ACP methyl ester carboxylesterase